jgi:hypothetical protein
MGCLPGDGDGIITVEYLSQLRSLGVSFGVLFYSIGVSIFTIPGQGPVRGLQHDTGLGYSFGSIFGVFPSPVTFSFAIQTDPPPDLGAGQLIVCDGIGSVKGTWPEGAGYVELPGALAEKYAKRAEPRPLRRTKADRLSPRPLPLSRYPL